MIAEPGRTRAGTVEIGGVTIGYRETGAPEDNPVVLLHALGSDARSWDRFAIALANAGRQAIALDLRGHGVSSRADDYTLELMLADVLGFLDHRGLRRVDLVGHSMGGCVAMLAAGLHPGRIRRMVLEDAPPPPMSQTSFWDDLPEPPPEPPEPVAFDWNLVLPLFRQVRRPDPEWWLRIDAIAAPTLVISGGPTSHIPPERLEELAAALPNARMVQIRVGHFVHSTSPERFAEVVLPFLAP
ncbi:MAG TPA: alpha/beta hydrolase [Actinophytocola sp.]|uniref:alpha/beta fold hydrolase n=1 Tax=Actinophytocola sp. TaxID=1872138 RepID=UPI002DDCE24A|nr:alpha/beta hydrolase [Actinophytocola sp.]HEV2783574.1 alpha/beta hydrolase [Actinophytocola sp.]